MSTLRAWFQTPLGRGPTRVSTQGSLAHRGGSPHRVVVVGAGFGGLSLVRSLKDAPVHVTLIDRRNFHLFQPLLYQVATGQLSPADIASPLRAVVGRQGNVAVLEAEVVDIVPDEQRVVLRDGEAVGYDTLVVCAGSTSHYFGRNEWSAHAPGLKSIEDATAIRSQILGVFERAERTHARESLASLLTFVIVGGGPTGVELAGAIAELTRYTLTHEYQAIRPADARILLVEGTDTILPSYPANLSAVATRKLSGLGVEVLTRTMVEEMGSEGVVLRHAGQSRRVAAQTILWAAGVKASPLASVLSRRTEARLDRTGRVHVDSDCSVPKYPNIFVVGDMAHFDRAEGGPLPGVAPVALQQGLYVAQVIRDRLCGQASQPFRYRDKGSLAIIGQGSAVADLRGLHVCGPVAWLLWLLVHIAQLVEFENRLLVFVQWLFSYLTGKRSARLITRGNDWRRLEKCHSAVD